MRLPLVPWPQPTSRHRQSVVPRPPVDALQFASTRCPVELCEPAPPAIPGPPRTTHQPPANAATSNPAAPTTLPSTSPRARPATAPRPAMLTSPRATARTVCDLVAKVRWSSPRARAGTARHPATVTSPRATAPTVRGLVAMVEWTSPQARAGTVRRLAAVRWTSPRLRVGTVRRLARGMGSTARRLVTAGAVRSTRPRASGTARVTRRRVGVGTGSGRPGRRIPVRWRRGRPGTRSPGPASRCRGRERTGSPCPGSRCLGRALRRWSRPRPAAGCPGGVREPGTPVPPVPRWTLTGAPTQDARAQLDAATCRVTTARRDAARSGRVGRLGVVVGLVRGRRGFGMRVGLWLVVARGAGVLRAGGAVRAGTRGGSIICGLIPASRWPRWWG